MNFKTSVPGYKVPDSEDVEGIFERLRERGIECLSKPEGIYIEAPTSYGLQYALSLIIESSERVKSEIVETVKDINEEIWEVFVFKEEEKRTRFEDKGGSITYHSTDVLLTGTDKLHEEMIEIKNIFESLKSKEGIETVDVGVDSKKAEELCQELMKSTDSNCECLVKQIDDRCSILIIVDKYDALTVAKHRLKMLKSGKKITARRPGHVENDIVLSETDPNHTEQPPLLAKPTRQNLYTLDTAASNLKLFKTNEGIKVYVYNADICKLPVECIVNAANERLQHAGGVARVIERAAGKQLTDEGDDHVRKFGPIKVGKVVATSAGNLLYHYVIHAVGPAWGDYQMKHNGEKRCRDDLYSAVFESFKEAERKRLKSIALPAISAGIVCHIVIQFKFHPNP